MGVCVCVCVCVCVITVQLCATPWTVAGQASLTREFSRQEYWSGLPFLSPEDLPNTGIEPWSPEFQVDFLPSEPPGKPDHEMSHDLGFTVVLACFPLPPRLLSSQGQN